MKYIQLTKGKQALIDDEDFERVNKHSWCTTKVECGYRAESRINNKIIRLHRFILNVPKGKYVDHIDRNPLNNQKGNLRICTNSQNMANTLKYKNNTAGYKGVHFNKKRKTFEAYITINYKHKYLGAYKTAIEAGKSYNKAALGYFGEFSNINTI